MLLIKTIRTANKVVAVALRARGRQASLEVVAQRKAHKEIVVSNKNTSRAQAENIALCDNTFEQQRRGRSTEAQGNRSNRRGRPQLSRVGSLVVHVAEIIVNMLIAINTNASTKRELISLIKEEEFDLAL